MADRPARRRHERSKELGGMLIRAAARGEEPPLILQSAKKALVIPAMTDEEVDRILNGD